MTDRLYYLQTNDRVLGADYSGDVLLWDIDKTYLDTHFSSWRGLLQIPFEFAIDKRTIPGAVALLRALRRGPGRESAVVPLYFVSGSPPQLRSVVERRMLLDGVDFDGITFKDQLGLLLAGRPSDIRGQVGYKLQALLSYRRYVPQQARWLLFGDDVEADAEVFLLFGEVCAGLRGERLAWRLRQHHVHASDVRRILALADEVGAHDDPVLRVFIHMERGIDPTALDSQRVVATRSYLQTVCVLCAMGKVASDAVAAVARDLRRRGVTESVISEQLGDAQERLHVPAELTELGRHT